MIVGREGGGCGEEEEDRKGAVERILSCFPKVDAPGRDEIRCRREGGRELGLEVNPAAPKPGMR